MRLELGTRRTARVRNVALLWVSALIAAVVFGIAMVSSGEEILAPLFLYGVMASLVTFVGVTSYVVLRLVALLVQRLRGVQRH